MPSAFCELSTESFIACCIVLSDLRVSFLCDVQLHAVMSYNSAVHHAWSMPVDLILTLRSNLRQIGRRNVTSKVRHRYIDFTD